MVKDNDKDINEGIEKEKTKGYIKKKKSKEK